MGLNSKQFKFRAIQTILPTPQESGVDLVEIMEGEGFYIGTRRLTSQPKSRPSRKTTHASVVLPMTSEDDMPPSASSQIHAASSQIHAASSQIHAASFPGGQDIVAGDSTLYVESRSSSDIDDDVSTEEATALRHQEAKALKEDGEDGANASSTAPSSPDPDSESSADDAPSATPPDHTNHAPSLESNASKWAADSSAAPSEPPFVPRGGATFGTAAPLEMPTARELEADSEGLSLLRRLVRCDSDISC